MESNIVAYLESQSTVTAQVGTSPNERIYSGDRPQGSKLPAITIQLVDSDHWHHLTAASGDAKAMIEIVSWATTKGGARTLSEIVRGEMQGFTDSTMGSLAVGSSLLIGETERRERVNDGSDRTIVGLVQDYEISYTQSVPTF